MSDSIAGLGPAADPTYGQGKQQEDPRAARRRAARFDAAGITDAEDLRLIIEDDPASHHLVYKTVDAHTGEVVQAVSDEQVQILGQATSYVAGQLIKARA
jgi:hypothetical protein